MNKIKHVLCIIFLFFLNSGIAFSEEYSTAVVLHKTPAEKLHSVKIAYPLYNGSTLSFPGKIVFDSKGNAWWPDTVSGVVVELLYGYRGQYRVYPILNEFRESQLSPGGTYSDMGNPGLRNIAVDHDDNVWIPDEYSGNVIELIRSSSYSERIFNAQNTEGLPSNPREIAVDSTDNVFISGGNDNTIVELKKEGDGEIVILGLSGRQNNTPVDLTMDSQDNLWIIDRNNRGIETGGVTELTKSSEYATQTSWNNSSCPPCKFNRPTGIVATETGSIFIANNEGTLTELELLPDGTYRANNLQTEDMKKGTTNNPYKLFLDSRENVWVSHYSLSGGSSFGHKMLKILAISNYKTYNTPLSFLEGKYIGIDRHGNVLVPQKKYLVEFIGAGR